MADPVFCSDKKAVIRIIASFLAGILAIPLCIGLYYNCPLHTTVGLVGSILIFQPVAAAIGIALGIPAVPTLLIMLSTGTGVIYLFFGICDLFANRSEWLRNHLDAVNAIAKRSALFAKYGIFTFIPFIWVPGVGLYGCVLLAWLFGWRDLRGVSIILAGWMLASLLVVGATIGVLGAIS
ncbi:MAG: hypothetical protein GYA23_03440 [Methanomicrobiales archaeon]|nr:hypothetical protein [Methanomicrobiales archaeon]